MLGLPFPFRNVGWRREWVLIFLFFLSNVKKKGFFFIFFSTLISCLIKYGKFYFFFFILLHLNFYCNYLQFKCWLTVCNFPKWYCRVDQLTSFISLKHPYCLIIFYKYESLLIQLIIEFIFRIDQVYNYFINLKDLIF